MLPNSMLAAPRRVIAERTKMLVRPASPASAARSHTSSSRLQARMQLHSPVSARILERTIQSYIHAVISIVRSSSAPSALRSRGSRDRQRRLVGPSNRGTSSRARASARAGGPPFCLTRGATCSPYRTHRGACCGSPCGSLTRRACAQAACAAYAPPCAAARAARSSSSVAPSDASSWRTLSSSSGTRLACGARR